jgi:hypothetical protein
MLAVVAALIGVPACVICIRLCCRRDAALHAQPQPLGAPASMRVNPLVRDQLELFGRVTNGASRSEVERILGKPVSDFFGEIHYLSPINALSNVYPAVSHNGAIAIRYSAGNTVTAKYFYGSTPAGLRYMTEIGR